MASAPSAPVVNSITFDQAAYNSGDKITVTVNYTAGTSGTTQTFTGTAKDSATLKTGTLTVNFTVVKSDTTSASASDSGGRTWTTVSDNAGVAVFTAIA